MRSPRTLEVWCCRRLAAAAAASLWAVLPACDSARPPPVGGEAADATAADVASAAQTAESPVPGLTGVWTNDPPESTRAFQNFSFSAAPPALTAWGQERYDQSKPTFGDRGVPVGETNDPVYECFPPGVPRAFLHPFPVEIVQTPGRVLMVFEYDHLIRQIYTDGREHRTDLAPMWMGDSIGRWEGDTLVVDTVNFNDKGWLDRRGVPHSDQLRVEERFRLIDADRLQIDIRIEDPVALAEPWLSQRFLMRTDWQIEEHACMDNVNFEGYEEEIQEFEAP
jgi:hypothetical protein